MSLLRDRMDVERQVHNLSMGELSVLSTRRDPYRLDTPAMHRDGAWLAEQIVRLAVKPPVHLRGLHYAVAVEGVVRKPNGEIYVNTDEGHGRWMQEHAAKAARWLGYVPFASVVDNRNDAPTVYVPAATTPYGSLICLFDFQPPDPDDLRLVPVLSDFAPRQPYRICLCGEKASLRPILMQQALRFGCEVVLPTGEMSDTLVRGIVDRAIADGRPLVVLYFADFDPSGWQMPISVARKIQAFADLLPDMPQVQVHRVAMIEEQVRKLGLPSTPLKEAERRADRWRAHWGLEQTEIDALVQLQPKALLDIARKAILPFFDTSLAHRRDEAERAWRARAMERIEAGTDQRAD